MKRYYYYIRFIVLLLIIIGSRDGVLAQTTVTEGGRFVTIDLEEFIAGTLIGGPSNNQIFENLGDSDSSVQTTTEIGFTIEATSDSGDSTVAVLYDTDRRQYEDANGNLTTVFDDIVGRVANSEGAASAGDDDDLEFDTDGIGQFVDGNTSLDTRVGNLLTVQENFSQAEVDQGHLNFAQGTAGPQNGAFAPGNHSPDDETGGVITLSFEAALTDYNFVWVDLEEPDAVSITFSGLVDANGNALADITIFFDEFEAGGSVDQGAVFGDRTVNAINIGIEDTPDLFDGLSLANGGGTADAISFDTVTFNTGDPNNGSNANNSGGVGQFAFRLLDPVTVFPEASSILSMATLLFMISGAAFWKRVRRKK